MEFGPKWEEKKKQVFSDISYLHELDIISQLKVRVDVPITRIGIPWALLVSSDNIPGRPFLKGNEDPQVLAQEYFEKFGFGFDEVASMPHLHQAFKKMLNTITSTSRIFKRFTFHMSQVQNHLTQLAIRAALNSLYSAHECIAPFLMRRIDGGLPRQLISSISQRLEFIKNGILYMDSVIANANDVHALEIYINDGMVSPYQRFEAKHDLDIVVKFGLRIIASDEDFVLLLEEDESHELGYFAYVRPRRAVERMDKEKREECAEGFAEALEDVLFGD